MKRILLGGGFAATVLAAVALFAVFHSERLQDALMRRLAEARVARAHDELYRDDALRVVFCGTGSPMPDPDRASACAAVFAAGHFFLIDAGPGGWKRLGELQIPTAGLEAVLFTHYHSDHVGGLGEFVLNSWAAGRTHPLRLYGPPGIERVAHGFEEAYALDSSYRTAHHGAKLMPPRGAHLIPLTIDVPTDRDETTVFEEGELVIRAFRVDHRPVVPAYGYRVDFRGRSVVFSGDTATTTTLVRLGKDADVMVHDALAPHMIRAVADTLAANGDAQRAAILRDTPSYHATPVEAAETANAAGVKLLVYTHVVPVLPNRLAERIFLRGVAEARGDGLEIAHDGLEIELPVGSDTIVQRDLR